MWRHLAIAFCLVGCVVPRPKASLDEREATSYVAVLSGEMPPPIDMVARHAWIIAHVPGRRDRRFEYGDKAEANRSTTSPAAT